MATLNIPKEDLPAFRKILDLSSHQFSSLLSALGTTKPTFGWYQFAKAVSTKTTTIKPGDITEILRVLFVLSLMNDEMWIHLKT